MQKVIDKILQSGYTIREIKGDLLVYKTSSKGIVKKAGKIYDNGSGVYFNSLNVPPFKQGKNSYKEIFGDNDKDYAPAKFIKKDTDNTIVIFSNKEFNKATQKEHTLQTFFSKTSNKPLNNFYDVRGVRNSYNNKQKNYLSNEVVYPYFDKDGQFQFAKIVSYGSDGKRIKGDFKTSWFHSYKPIKKALNILDKTISKPTSIFFGEHLIHKNDKVIIVEGEKSAVLLSEIFAELDITFLSTGGANGLSGLNYDGLKNKDVYLFPDKGVKEWFDIGAKQGWHLDKILENNKDAKDNDDVCDFIGKPLWSVIEKRIKDISCSSAVNRKNQLNWREKPKQKATSCRPNFSDFKFRAYEDECAIENPSMESFAGENFKFYEHKFNSISANIDFNEWEGFGLGVMPPTKETFLFRLEKMFRVSKYINSSAEYFEHVKSIKDVFPALLHYIRFNSNYYFDVDYVMSDLVPEWDSKGNDITEYISKPRNWRVLTGGIPNNEFEKLLAEDKKRYSTNKFLKIFKEHSKNGFYVSLKNDIGLSRRNENSFVWDLIKAYNEKVIGCTTINQWNKALEIQEYCNKIYLENNELVQKVCTPYRVCYIEYAKSEPTFKPISINSIVTRGKISKRSVQKYYTHKPDLKVQNKIDTVLDYLLEFPSDISFKRTNRRYIEVTPLYNFKYMKNALKLLIEQEKLEQEYKPLQQDKMELPIISIADAFTGDMKSWKDGVYGCSEQEANGKGDDEFLYHWICINYNITGLDKTDVWANLDAYRIA